MSEYTTEVRFICELNAGLSSSKGFNDVDAILTASAPKIFSFDFPIFDEAYRLTLEKKILKHYYTREICEETVGLWKLRLDAKMNEIMPYYNQLYESARLEFDPLLDVNYRREGEKHDAGEFENTGNGESTNDGHSNGRNSRTDYNLFSDTPQGALTGVESEEYLTSATKDTASGENHNSSDSHTVNSSTNSGSNSTDGDYWETIKGKMGGTSYSKMLQEYRKTFLNIDMMVIDELSTLFFNLW